jgi:hypothetical protein
MELDEWLFMYAKAEFVLHVIRRRPLTDADGIPIVDPKTEQYITIPEYPHLDRIHIFGESADVEKTTKAPPPLPEYEIDPRTGNPIFKKADTDTLSGTAGFSFKLK